MRKTLLFAALLLGCATGYSQQRYLGMATSNWSGISGTYLNPASMAGSHDRLVIDFFGLNAGVDNSLGTINSLGEVRTFIKDDNADVNNVFSFSNKNQFSLLAPYGELRGPGAMYSINSRHTIGISTRLRGMNQFNNFDQTLYRTILDTSYASHGNVDLTAQNFNWTAHLWSELNLSYAVRVIDKGRHRLNAGVTLRYLGGIGYLGLKGNNLDAHYVKGQDSFYARNTDLTYASNILTAEGALGISNSNFFKKFFGTKDGTGIGGDIGVVYDYLGDTLAGRYEMDGRRDFDDPNTDRYTFRVSASVLDMGHIYYRNNNNYALSVSGDGYLTSKGLSDNVKNFDDFRRYAKQNGFDADTGRTKSRLYMPATFLLSVDYHVWRKAYVNAMWTHNLANRQNFGNSFYDQLSVIPRWDCRNYSVAIPVTYSWLTSNLKAGIGLRYRGFYLGSDDMLVIVSKKQYGMNIYAGASYTLHKKRIKDSDGDHVSDRKDRCPEEQGTWRRHGCPEKDNDTTDNCPAIDGLNAQQQEKDTDGDGIADAEDACPNVAGTADNHGCPDKNAPKKVTIDLTQAVLVWQDTKKHFSEEEYKSLDRFAKILKDYPEKTLLVEAFCSNAKNDDYITRKRAEFVKKYLKNKGVASSRINAMGRGDGHDGAQKGGAPGNFNVILIKLL